MNYHVDPPSSSALEWNMLSSGSNFPTSRGLPLGGVAGNGDYHHIKVDTEGRMITTPDIDMESLADQLWKKMYERPVIVPCNYCKAHNAFSNPCCVMCGAPMGENNNE